MKKTLAFLMALIMLVGLVPAAMAEAPADITSWIIVENPEKLEGELEFWVPFKGSQGMDDMIAEFNSIYPNIKINLNVFSNNTDGNASVNSAMVAGEVDVLASFGLHHTYKRWENAMFVDLTDKVAELGIDLIANWGSDAYTYDGSVYTFPCGGLGHYVAINMTDWNEAGLGELPTEWTWDEYLAASAKMTKGEGDTKVYGGADYSSIEYFTWPWYQVHGKDNLYTAEGKSNLTEPLIINALKREIKAEQEDGIWFPLVTFRADNIKAADAFQNHNVASIIVCNLVRYLNPETATWITGFAPYPVEEKGQTNYVSGIPIFSHVGISTECEQQEAAWAFTAFYATYGSKYLIKAGHASTWKGTDASGMIEMLFGSEENAAKVVDVESFKRCVVNYENPAYIDTVITAYDEVMAIAKEYCMYAHQGTMTVEDAMAEAAEKCNEAIADAQ